MKAAATGFDFVRYIEVESVAASVIVFVPAHDSLHG
jgi:hypothetical protein